MNIFKRIKILTFILAPACLMGMESKRETVLDRIQHIEPTIVNIPKIAPLCDEIMELKKSMLDINEGSLYCEEEGVGTPLVLINGGPGGSHHVFHPYFSEAAKFAHVIYYDQRGTGQSSADDSGKTYTIKQAVEDLDQLRARLGLDKWFVLGWSYGGFLAQCYALTYPEHVLGLMLVAAGDGLTNVEMKPSRDQMFISDGERTAINKIYADEEDGKIGLMQTNFNKDICGDWKRQHFYKPTSEEFARTALYEWNPAPGFHNLMNQEYFKISLDGKFDDFEIPTLIFEAKWDLTWDMDKAEFMRKNHPNAQFEYFEKSGHKIFADEPVKFFALLKTFIESALRTSYVCKSGNRLVFPEPPSPLMRKFAIVRSMPQSSERDKLMLECYEQSLKDGVTDNSIWGSFVYHLIKMRDFEKALVASQNSEHSLKSTDMKTWQKIGYCIKSWQGHMFDLLGKREQAIMAYTEALQAMKGEPVEDSFGIKIDRQWLEDRLKSPFTNDMLK